MFRRLELIFFCISILLSLKAQDRETLPILTKKDIPKTHTEMWKGFDPRAEPLETEILKEWTQDGVVLRVLRYRIGIFKGQKAWMAGVFGFPKAEKIYRAYCKFMGEGSTPITKQLLPMAKEGMLPYRLHGLDEFLRQITVFLQAR